jgi:hypothetical protein
MLSLKNNSFANISFGFVVLSGAMQCFRIGAYWDLEVDTYFSRVNAFWLRDGVPNSSDLLFDNMRNYSYTLLYISEIPRILLTRYQGVPESFLTPNWIVYRNLFTFGILLIGIVALSKWLSPKIQNKSIVLLAIFSFPTVLGYGFFNLKDVAVFSGVCISLALIRMTVESTGANPETRISIKFFFLSFLMVIFTLGVRPSSYILLIPALLLIIADRVKKRTLNEINSLSAGLVAGLISIYLTSATLQEDGLRWFLNSFQSSSNFELQKGIHLLAWGKIYPAGETRTYPLVVLISQMPDWVIFVTAVALLFVLRDLPKVLIKRKTIRVNFIQILESYPIFAFLALIAYVTIFKPILYDDSRQLFFIWAYLVPTIIAIVLYLRKKVNSYKFKHLLYSFFFISFGISLINSILLSPFNYTYKNTIALTSKPQGFESDYWALSSKEVSLWLQKQSDINTGTLVNAQPPGSFSLYLKDKVKLNVSEKPDYFISINRPTGLSDNQLQCEIVKKFVRKQIFTNEILMAYVRKCS